MNEIIGLLLLFTLAAALLFLLITAIIVRDLRRPPRHTAGYAVAHSLPCDPAERGLPFDAWQLDLPDGTILPVWEIHQDHHPEDPTIVLIHGWGESRIDSLARIDVWLPHACRLVLYDLRGHGDAESSLSRLGFDEQNDLLALLERLAAERIVLAGYSLGAAIAIRAAAEDHPVASTISAIIAIGPSVHFHASLNRTLRSGHYPSRPFTDAAMLWLRLRGLREPPLLEAARTLRCPMLVVSGEDDPVSPVADGCQLAEAAPHARFVGMALNLHERKGPQDDHRLPVALASFLHSRLSSTGPGAASIARRPRIE